MVELVSSPLRGSIISQDYQCVVRSIDHPFSRTNDLGGEHLPHLSSPRNVGSLYIIMTWMLDTSI